MSSPKISPAAQAERNLERLAAIAQDHADPRLDDLRERLAGLAADLQRQAIRDHNQAARLDNLAGALAELQADLAAGHKHRPRLALHAAALAEIAADIAKEAGR